MSSSQPARRLGRRGNATLEFAMFAAVALMLLLAGVDVVSYLRGRLRLDQVSGGMANLVTGFDRLYAGDFPMLFLAAQRMAGDLAVTGQDGATVITGLVNPAGQPYVAWRRQTGNPGFASTFGPVGSAPQNLPDGYALPAGASVVAVEVFSAVHPWVLAEGLMGTPGAPVLRSAALYQPRSSLLSDITAGNRP